MLAFIAAASLAVTPPIAFKRPISSDANWPGTKIVKQEGSQSIVLYIPRGWKPKRGERFSVHFHGPDWLSMQEMEARGGTNPLIHVSAGEGSTVYHNCVQPSGTLDRWLNSCLANLRQMGAPADVRVTKIDLSSFSAGYGAIRDLIREPSIFQRLDTVILGDSMYASLASDTGPRKVLPEHTEVWLPLAREAVAGRKTFVVSVSMVPTPAYASSWECLAALTSALGIPQVPVECPAAHDPNFPLLSVAERGRFFGWQYGGTGPDAHTTHARHLADIWKALQPATAPAR